ncbi:hypothetical protein [Mycobacterium paraterrae]|uniref:Uncharacterized protein n=1 Tax=Mycobacterium paraterrae TaxID=577492 RepID=A0ABY3VSA5_9MYCO|nr:hypothetical protein [Mycobacterium paraterrae]UMB70052.1 hypothetical protein MKK62_01455 [Mycobacterium paraterrae]
MLESYFVVALFTFLVLSPLMVPIFITVQPQIAAGFRSVSRLISRPQRTTARTPAISHRAGAHDVQFSSPADRFPVTASVKS